MTETAASSYIFRLLDYCRRKGITTLFTNQITGFNQSHEVYGFGFSSFVDTMIFLDYVQIGGELNRTLLIMKSRGSEHSNQYREFLITAQGIRFMEVYTGKGGMLTGVARLEQELREQLEIRQRELSIAAKKQEINLLRSTLQTERTAAEAQIGKATIELGSLENENGISQIARKRREQIRNSTPGGGESRLDEPSYDDGQSGQGELP